MVTVRLYVGSLLSDCPTFGCGRTAPEVSDVEGSYTSHFYRWFVESIKNCLLLLVAPPGLIDTLAQLLAWRSLLWLSMTWQWRFLTQSNFLSTTSLTWSLALHSFCFSQEKSLRWKEINTHTYTQICALLYAVDILRDIPFRRYTQICALLYTVMFMMSSMMFKISNNM